MKVKLIQDWGGAKAGDEVSIPNALSEYLAQNSIIESSCVKKSPKEPIQAEAKAKQK